MRVSVIVRKMVLLNLFLSVFASGLCAQEETDRRIADLKNAFEEITASFRQRMVEVEEKHAMERQTLTAERDAALAARDAGRLQIESLEASIKSLETQLTASEASQEALRQAQANQDSVQRQKDDEIARLQGALAALETSNARERFALAYNLGSIYKAARQYERAETQFLKALDMNANDPALQYNLGILYDDNLKNAKKARKHYERFLELAPSDPDAPNVIKWLKEL